MSPRTLAALLVAAAIGLGPAATAYAVPSTGASEPGPQPYLAPPFRSDCVVHRFAEGESPELDGYPDDPLCVEYSKRDITLDNGGAVAFLLAEPNRFAIALDKCAYWQQDHWSVQASRGETPIVRWDGSYWFDKGAGQAAARVKRLTVAGEPATLKQAAAYVKPYSPELAAYFRDYARGGDGMGYSGAFPFDPSCA